MMKVYDPFIKEFVYMIIDLELYKAMLKESDLYKGVPLLNTTTLRDSNEFGSK